MFDIDIVCLSAYVGPWTKFHLGDARLESLVERIDMYIHVRHPHHTAATGTPSLPYSAYHDIKTDKEAYSRAEPFMQ